MPPLRNGGANPADYARLIEPRLAAADEGLF